MVFGLTPGLLGLLAGLASGGLMGARLLRDKPWDIHDERSYAEPARLSMGVLAPSIIFFITLLTMTLGLAALDRDIDLRFGLAGDGLGAIDLLFTVVYLLATVA
jgi:hypothetical protein